MTTEYTTLDVARRMTEVATALADYAHLPALERVHVFAGGTVFLGFPPSLDSKDKLSRLCRWAAEFGVDITITLSYGGSGEALIRIDVAGCSARLSVSLHSGQAYELGAALRRPIGADQPEIRVTPAELLAAIDGGGGDG